MIDRVIPIVLVTALATGALADGKERGKAVKMAREIDRLVDAGLREAGVTPNPRTSDELFARRVYLDIIGRIPTHRELTDFLASNQPDKRYDLIDQLLETEGYVSHTYNYWADILRIKTRLVNQVPGAPYTEWVKAAIRDNMPYDQFVYELLVAEGRVTDNGAAGYFIRDTGMPLDNMANTLRIFLGTRIGCAQCHDHPFDKWTQYEFYEMAAFTAGTQTRQRYSGANPRNLIRNPDLTQNERRIMQRLFQSQQFAVHDDKRGIRLPDDYKYNDAEPRERVLPRTILGEEVAVDDRYTPRLAFAAWLTDADNPRFAPTIANRLWKRAFGIGIVEPVDDFTDDTVPSNAALLEYLSQQMRAAQFDVRAVSRAIYYSKAYQRQSTTEEVDPTRPYAFPGPVLKRMTAEQLWDSLMTLMDPQIDGRVGPVTYISLEDMGLDIRNLKPEQVVARVKELAANGGPEAAMRRQMRDQRARGGGDLVRASESPAPARPGSFLETFGAADRELIDSSQQDPTISQALEMLNGRVTNGLLDSRTAVGRLVAGAPDAKEKTRVLFLSILGREPSKGDVQAATAEIQADKDGARHVAAALLNTREFMFVQ